MINANWQNFLNSCGIDDQLLLKLLQPTTYQRCQSPLTLHLPTSLENEDLNPNSAKGKMFPLKVSL